MACPYFEPQHVASDAKHPLARLPLLEEYDGVCRAAPQPFSPEAGHRFQYCNQGNVEGACSHFPLTGVATSFRYHVAASDTLHLEVLMVEEKQHWPHSWRRIHFQIATGQLNPAEPDPVICAQLLAFCNSYLKRFAPLNEPG
jgi:hypothetical protein